jgi:hypothetical protein
MPRWVDIVKGSVPNPGRLETGTSTGPGQSIYDDHSDPEESVVPPHGNLPLLDLPTGEQRSFRLNCDSCKIISVYGRVTPRLFPYHRYHV